MSLADYDLNSFQVELLTAVLAERFPIAVRGGVGSGKTAAIAFLCVLLAETRPGCRLLVVMKTTSNLHDVLRPTFDELCRAGRAQWSERHSRYTFPNGSIVMMRYYDLPRSADEARNPIEGRDCHVVIVDEAQMLEPRVLKHATQRARQKVRDETGRDRRAGVILLGRPSAAEWHPAAVIAAGGVVLNPTSHVNAHNLSATYIDDMRATMSEAEFRAVVECGPMPVEGAYFHDWREDAWPAGNILADFTYSPTATSIAAIDLGIGWPAVVLIQPVTRRLPDGTEVEIDVAFDDIAPDDVTTSELARDVSARAWPAEGHGPPPPSTPYLLHRAVCDPAGHQRNAQTRRTDIQVLQGPPLQAKGLSGLGVPVRAPTDPARRDVMERGQRIRAVIRTADGVRRFCLAPELARRTVAGRSLRTALMQYSWDHLRAARSGSKTRTPGQPDHHIDALGYYVAQYRWLLTPPRTVARASGLFG